MHSQQEEKTDAQPEFKGIELIEDNRLARLKLTNQARRNAVSDEMRAGLRDAFARWVEDPHIYCVLIESAHDDYFSSGGDLKEILQNWQEGREAALDSFKDEYETIWKIDCYTKPVISLINGAVMGGGIGISQYGTHKIAGENYAWSMPECRIGLFPDIGISHKLCKMPHAIGYYLGLTGRSINREDAFYLGLIEHCIDSDKFGDIRAALSEADPVDVVLDTLHKQPPAGELQKMAPLIEQVFAKPGINEILAELHKIEGEHQNWAKSVLEDLRAASPMSLMVTFEAITRAKSFTNEPLEATLRQDYVLVQNFMNAHDFKEGITARLIEKRPPAWQPQTLDAIDDRLVEACFKDPGLTSLDLPSRELGLYK